MSPSSKSLLPIIPTSEASVGSNTAKYFFSSMYKEFNLAIFLNSLFIDLCIRLYILENTWSPCLSTSEVVDQGWFCPGLEPVIISVTELNC